MAYKIYSVEDDKDISKIINRTLTHQGYIVNSFENGKDFFKAFNQEKPDMVLLDMMLPDISGTEILKTLRDDITNDDIDIIIVSANRMVMDKVDGLDLGADDYIEKPFDLLELSSRVNAKFRRHKKEHIFQSNDLSIDTESHKFSYKGEEITLTVKEFQIIEILLKNKGKVVTRDQILNEIWGLDGTLESRTVDMHVKSIRSKCKNDEVILTIYGVGYKVKE